MITRRGPGAAVRDPSEQECRAAPVPPAVPTDADRKLKLAPEMASMRLLVLAFVRDYIRTWGQSPSLGEISNALGIQVSRTRRALKSLEAEKLIERVPGHRGIRMPSARAECIRQLREMGFLVDEDLERAVVDPGSDTNRLLPATPVLDYLPPLA